ncbi:MAG: CHAT domain-containing protein [Bacteroidales bacterium]|nr:CHAT domain-containing protein [Bacteroidales bacterium]
MQTFYNNLLRGVTINKAFRKRQAIMKQKYNPYYWAAFVLIE